MRKFILTFIFALIATLSFSQPRHFNYNVVRPDINLTQYSVIDSLPIERILIHFNKEVDDDRFLDMGSGDYLAPVPYNDKMIIKTNQDRTKAIVIHNSYSFGRHLEFDIQENERRLILYFKDDNIYCGYIYDKYYKVCKYFESKKEYKRFMNHRFFMRNRFN